MARDFHLPGRSPVYAREGMVATAHPLASLAAIEVLRAGGNAADAAVTAVALLGVIEPHMTGIGGDCFCLIAKPGQPVWGYNGSGRTGAALSLDALLAQGLTGSIPQDSIHAITVPGALDAWDAILSTHGTYALDRVLAPAIRAAEDGFAVGSRVAYDWALNVERLRKNKGATLHYLPNGKAPAEGDILRLPALAATLKRIAKNGAREFYDTDIAQDIVDTVRPLGNFLAVEDFTAHRGEEVVPIFSNYRGLDIVELPPNGQGLAALVLLNILERFEIGKLDPYGVDRAHIALEACRLAYAVRDTHVADPVFMRMPVPRLLDREFAADLASKIDITRRSDLPQAPGPRGDTTLVTVVDRDRNAVSMINSLFVNFGSAVATERTGILLHNRGMSFVLGKEHPNCAGPRKRPMHTIIPALAMRGDKCEMAFGVMGGSYQSMGHAHFISNVVDHGMDVQAAIDAPRYFFEGQKIVAERGVPHETFEGLKKLGHDMMRRPLPLGGGQAIRIDWERGVLVGGSDGRKDGCALGY